MSLAASQTERWNQALSQRQQHGNDLQFTLKQLAKQLGEEDVAGLEAFLTQQVQTGAVQFTTAYRCPIASCLRLLPQGASLTECPYCKRDYREEGTEATPEAVYRLDGEQSRDIRWMIVIHGMNSRAPWQEAFSWEIANQLRYSAPVLIYKYGWATIEVLLAPLHRRLAKRLGQRMRLAIEQARRSGRPERPDVIAHSFGTRLLALVLQDPGFQDIRLGRVITAGSIIRPDFDWQQHLQNGRIEAVLNHVAARDIVVPFAQLFIPGSGPGGRVGYMSKAVLNVRELSYRHSDFFVSSNLTGLIQGDGLWRSFLTRPLSRFKPAGAFEVSGWQRLPWYCLGLPRVLGGMIFLVGLPFSLLRRWFDP